MVGRLLVISPTTDGFVIISQILLGSFYPARCQVPEASVNAITTRIHRGERPLASYPNVGAALSKSPPLPPSAIDALLLEKTKCVGLSRS